MNTPTWHPGVSAERRVHPDRRTEHSVLSQEALARIIVETRGDDSYAGQALHEREQRRQASTTLGTGEDELIVYSLRGRWIVANVREARQAMLAAAAAACRRWHRSAEPTPPQLIAQDEESAQPTRR